MDTIEAVDRAASLHDLLMKSAEEGERQRTIPDEVVDAIEAEGLFEVVVPSSLGGHGLGLDAVAGVARTMGRGCPATAWTASFLMLHGWLLSKFGEEARAELFADGRMPMAAAPLAPSGKAVPTDGGFEVSGRWEWATGIAHSTWVMVHAIVEGPGFSTLFALVPVEECTIDDVWFTSGMRATGSRTVDLTSVFVPAHRTIDSRELLASPATVDGDGLDGLAVGSVLAIVASSPALGAAETSLELYRERLRSRVLAYSIGDKAAEQPVAQSRLGAVQDIVSTTVARWEQAIHGVTTGPPLDLDARVDARLAVASVVRSSRQAISMICEGAGASVYFESHPLQRFQRDVETLKGHVLFDWDRTTELVGRYHLGLGLRPADML